MNWIPNHWSQQWSCVFVLIKFSRWTWQTHTAVHRFHHYHRKTRVWCSVNLSKWKPLVAVHCTMMTIASTRSLRLKMRIKRKTTRQSIIIYWLNTYLERWLARHGRSQCYTQPLTRSFDCCMHVKMKHINRIPAPWNISLSFFALIQFPKVKKWTNTRKHEPIAAKVWWWWATEQLLQWQRQQQQYYQYHQCK